MNKYFSRFSLRYPISIIYMLQSTEYKISEYFKWLKRTKDFRTVSKRGKLTLTAKTKILLAVFITLELSTFILSLFLIFSKSSVLYNYLGLVIFLTSPIIAEYLIILPLFLGEHLIQKPRSKRIINEAKQKLSQMNVLKIAIIGSYGKTSAKEILATVLSDSKNLLKTPGNINTLIGISRFIKKIESNPEVIIFELGEEYPGDIRKLCDLVQPDLAIITGISEAHLSSFKNMENLINTIFEIDEFLDPSNIYVNIENSHIKNRVQNKPYRTFGKNGCSGMDISNIMNEIDGLKFDLKRDKKIIHVDTKILGDHNIGIICAAVDIAKNLNIPDGDIEQSLKKIIPFKHRMSPRFIDGAVIIDDTYNGNSEGIRVGLEYLSQLNARRKIYITPGLVEQGDKTREIHIEIGKQISQSADIVYLMKNSTTEYIIEGLKNKKYNGTINIVNDPLDFYTNIESLIAAGDVVLMQNDWTDNYA